MKEYEISLVLLVGHDCIENNQQMSNTRYANVDVDTILFFANFE